MTLRAHLVRGVAGSLGLTVAAAALAFVNGILLARLLGLAGYGIYASVIAVVLLLSYVLTLGLDRLIVREVAALGGRGDWAGVRGLIQGAVRIVVPESIVVVLCLASIGWLLREQLHDDVVLVLWLGLAMVPLSNAMALRSAVALGLHLIVNAQLPETIVRPGLFAVMLLVALASGMGTDPALAMALNLLATIVALVVGLAVLARRLPAELVAARPRFETRRWLAAAVPFALLIAVNTFVLQIDVLLVAGLAGAEAAGLYSVAARGASLALFGAAAVGVTLGPTIARLWDEQDLPRLRLAVTRGTRGAFAFAVAVAIVLIAFGEQFLLLFGPEFVAAREPLALLAIAQVVDVGLGMGGVLLTMTGLQSYALRAGLVAAVVRVAIGVWLIPTLGPNGAAIAAIASMAAFNGLMAVVAIRRLRVDPTPLGLVMRE